MLKTFENSSNTLSICSAVAKDVWTSQYIEGYGSRCQGSSRASWWAVVRRGGPTVLCSYLRSVSTKSQKNLNCFLGRNNMKSPGNTEVYVKTAQSRREGDYCQEVARADLLWKASLTVRVGCHPWQGSCHLCILGTPQGVSLCRKTTPGPHT